MDGSRFAITGKTRCDIEINMRNINITAIVAEFNKYEVIIGMDVLGKIGAIIDTKLLYIYMLEQSKNNELITSEMKMNNRNRKKSKVEDEEVMNLAKREESSDKDELIHKERMIVEED